VIHTVGPIWHGGDGGEPALLASAYTSSLVCAAEEALETVAFPSISTGAYGYPMDRAARVAIGAVIDFLRQEASSIREVRFVLFAEPHLAVWTETLAEFAGVIGST
jgi:O-acetyl-ADP-ribose deacetylase (regulator of RNase III)